jgi:hypothetical protein
LRQESRLGIEKIHKCFTIRDQFSSAEQVEKRMASLPAVRTQERILALLPPIPTWFSQLTT